MESIVSTGASVPTPWVTWFEEPNQLRGGSIGGGFDEREGETMSTRHTRAAAVGLALLLGLVTPPLADAQTVDSATRFVDVAGAYRLVPNITYLRAGGLDLKLDVYQARGAGGPNQTLMYIHGGGWTNGNKEGSALTFLPYLEMGWNVVNVEYRMADVAHAPAAVEDCRCALRWIHRNAEQYNFDLDRIVVTGNSAGGHLSLTTGMVPASAGLDRQVSWRPEPHLVDRARRRWQS